EHFRGQPHHPRGLGGVQGHVWVRIDAVHHADVTHVFHTTDDEYIAVAGLDGLHGSVQRTHRRTAQAADGLRGAGVRNLGHQRRHAGDVPALLQSLVDAAPDHVFDFGRVDLVVTVQQLTDQVCRHVLGTGIAVHAALRAAHRGAAEIDNNRVSRIKTHISLSRSVLSALTEELLAVGGHFTKLGSRGIQRAEVGILVGQGNEFSYTDGIDVTQRTTPEGREANAVDQTHVSFGSRFDDAVFQTTHGFQAQRDHHEVDDVLVGDFALLVNDRRQYVLNGRIDDLLRLAALVGLVDVEALAVLLAEAVGFVQGVDSGLALFLHAFREAFGHHVAGM